MCTGTTKYSAFFLPCVPVKWGTLVPVIVSESLRTAKHQCQERPSCSLPEFRNHAILTISKGVVDRVSIACPLPNGYREWIAPPCTPLQESLDCAVAALPPELLSYVFSMNVLSDRPAQKNGKYDLGWISVTQVCHRWREVCAATYQPGFPICVH
jgi:hypothetical protein